MSARLEVNQFQDGLRAKSFGRSLLFSREIESTNNWAKELATYGAHEGTVVIAETQTKGRGRLGREWISPVGGLWFSLILRPKLPPAEAVKLTFVAGLAVAEVLHEALGLSAVTKWPNDVLVNGRKICGILTEMNTTDETVNFVVTGFGINANFDVERAFPNTLRNVATSIEKELGRKIQLHKLFQVLLERLEDLYELFITEGFSPILKKWKASADFLGRQVTIIGPAEEMNGLALDVDSEGALILQLPDKSIKRILVGDVSLQAY